MPAAPIHNIEQFYMKNLIFIFICLWCLSCTRSVYVVRHAEKIASSDSLAKMMANDLPLSEAGKVRALVLGMNWVTNISGIFIQPIRSALCLRLNH